MANKTETVAGTPKNKAGFWRWVWRLFVTATICGLLAAFAGGYYVWRIYDACVSNPPAGHELPDVATIGTEVPLVVSKVTDRTGKTEIGAIAIERRTVLPLGEIPMVMRHAALAAEDAKFYEHGGVSFEAMAKALYQKLRHPNSRLRGASTITQQVVKPYVGNARSIERKMREAVLAVRLSKIRTKDEILSLYLNKSYLGHRRYGVEEAAQYYFGKSVRNITLAEAALLASLPKGPNNYPDQPGFGKWRARQKYVLEQMQKHGWATPTDVEAAIKAPITLIEHPPVGGLAPEYVVEAERELTKTYGDKLVTTGLIIKTPVDLEIQSTVRQILLDGVNAIDAENGDKPRPQAAAVVIDNKTGEKIASVGGVDTVRGNFDRITQARRQPGSAFKTIGTLAALEGEEPLITPSTSYVDSVFTYEIKGSKPWTPRNHGKATDQPVTLRVALEKSMNTVYGQVVNQIGAERVALMARRLGIKSKLANAFDGTNQIYPPSIILGSQVVTPLELAHAYSNIARGGYSIEPPSVIVEARSTSTNEVVIPPKAPEREQVMSKALAWLVTDMLRGVVTRGTAIRASRIKWRQQIAGKTGTTQNEADAWFVGYSPDHTVLVWVGYDDNSPMGYKFEGAHAALPMWIKIMQAVQQNAPLAQFGPPPDGIVHVGDEFYLDGKVPPPTDGLDAGDSPDGGEAPATNDNDVDEDVEDTDSESGADTPASADDD